jgi:hypothetical protein
VRTSFGNSSALDSVFEIEFNQDPPLGKTISSLLFSTGNSGQAPIPFTESIPRPHVLRLTTTTLRRAGYYVAALSNVVTGGINAPRFLSTTLGATPLGGTAAVATMGPAPSDTGVPLNASPRVLFGAAINPLTATVQSVVVSFGGSTVPTRIAYPNNSREILLLPQQAPAPNTSVTVHLSGLEDMAGRRISDYSWTFTTGTDPDFAGPTILYTSLPSVVSGVGLGIAATEAVQVVFSKPVDPGISVEIGAGSGFLREPGQRDAAGIEQCAHRLRGLAG